MKKLLKKTSLTLTITIIVAIMVIALGLLWLYTGKLNSTKAAVFSKLPLPIALVNNQPVLGKDLFFRQRLAEKLSNKSAPDSATIFNQILLETQISQIAATQGVTVSPQELNKAYADYASQENLSGQANFADILKSYGISQSEFIANTLLPDLTLYKLQSWFYSEQTLNQNAFRQAQDLLNQIQSGQDMGALAKKYSQDGSGADLAGDLGFVEPGRLLPELQEPIDAMAVGETKILPSRYGLQAVRLEGKSGNLVHLRSIFINGSDFQAWLSAQKQKIKVIKLINI